MVNDASCATAPGGRDNTAAATAAASMAERMRHLSRERGYAFMVPRGTGESKMGGPAAGGAADPSADR